MPKTPLSDHSQFRKDMKAAGVKVYDYAGRNFWKGPAVNVNDLQEAMSYTKVQCQYDSMGKGYVVYPKAFTATESRERL